MAIRGSPAGGGRGVLPAPSTIESRGKPSSCALCSATSTTREAICTTPARLPVGVSTSVTRSGATPQSLETFSASAAGGWRPVSSTRQVLSARSRYPISSNSGSRTASARAGPEPSALNFPGASKLKLQPAYWLARQASTGRLVRTSTCHGQLGNTGLLRSATSPRPAMQIRATSSPASMPPWWSMPASTTRVPSSMRVTPTRNASARSTSAATKGAAVALTLGNVLTPYLLEFRDSLTEMDSRYPLSRARASRE